MRAVEVRNVTVRAPVAPIRRFDLTAHAREVLLVLGDAGVSTLARTLAGALLPAAGTVRIDGDDVTGRNDAGVLLVPAGWTPFLHLSVVENVLVGARGSRPRATAVLDRMPLLAPDRGAADLHPHDVRLLAVAVALARRPRLLVVDGLLVSAGAAGYVTALHALRADGVAAVVAERATFDGRDLVVPDRIATEQYDRLYVVRDGAVRVWTPGQSATDAPIARQGLVVLGGQRRSRGRCSA